MKCRRGVEGIHAITGIQKQDANVNNGVGVVVSRPQRTSSLGGVWLESSKWSNLLFMVYVIQGERLPNGALC